MARSLLVRDFDICKAFPSMVLLRYPDLKWIEKWVRAPEALAEAAGLDAAVVKDYVNAAAGAGAKMEREWMALRKLSVIPEVLQLYLADVKRAVARDRRASNFHCGAFWV